ncbi:VaFE repeat-containing surface-anchored protein [Corynebacterium tuberculostearicum]|nr:VaFE repeat-containing surface-anchored protein [Corynebacterium tuberculostearicum]
MVPSANAAGEGELFTGWSTSNVIVEPTQGGVEKDVELEQRIYVGDPNVDNPIVAYCFNADQSFPVSRESAVNKGAQFRKERAVGQLFTDNARKPRLQDNEALKSAVLRILYNGEPNDAAGIRSQFDLSNDEFAHVTQAALWYYTDSMDEGTALRKAGFDKWNTGAPDRRAAYYALLEKPNPDTPDAEVKPLEDVPGDATLNLYLNNAVTPEDMKGAYPNKYTQNLLGAQFVNKDTGEPIKPPAEETAPAEPTTEVDTITTTPKATVIETAETEVETITTTPKATTTITEPTATTTATVTEGVTTTKVTVPATATETETETNSTTTEKVPGTVVTETETEPNSTTTENVPGTVVTETETEPNSTTTENVPGTVVTETETEPNSTTTEKVPGTVVTTTETAPEETTTVTTTPAKATVTTTVPVVTKVENAPYIGTKATDKADGDKKLEANGGVVVDTIDYIGLKPGEEYTMKGELMEKDKDGNVTPTGIKAEKTFTPEASEGSIDVEFTVPEGYEEKTLVVFEELEKDGEVVAEHKKPESVNQTVVIGERTPLIGTIAHEKDSDESDKIIDNGKVVDKVEYTNFIPGKEYTIKGELINYRDGKPSGIKAEKTFTPEEANGVVELEFDIPENFGTEVLVAFETAYDADGNKIAEHVDLNDGAQTIATGTDKPGKGHKDPKKLLGLIPLALIPFIGGGSSEGSSNGSSNGSSSHGSNEAPKGEAPKGEAPQNSEAQQGEQAEQTEAQPSRGLLASTGANVWMLVLVGIVLLGIGGALAFRGRRES